jgi:hypothetical protein
MIKKILISILFVSLLLYIVLVQYFGDVEINKYTNRDAVLQYKIIEKGWVPAILPKSAYDISETHDIDTNELFGSFYYYDIDEAKLFSKLKLLSDTNETYQWGNFLFKVDREKNYIQYRNKTISKK